MVEPITYYSTRGAESGLGFQEVVLKGLAADGGLYIPSHLPRFSSEDQAAMEGLSYPALAHRILKPFVGDALSDQQLLDIFTASYGKPFRHAAIAPLKQIGEDSYVQELFHGPTLAFKDFALQVLGRLFDAFSAQAGRPLTIMGATSGDTGSAAIEACRGRENVRIIMLHPHGRVSDVQRRQMTTVLEDNVINLAIEGTFDDCQALVKAAFMDKGIRDACQLTAVNSINWARVVAQTVYYARASLILGHKDRLVHFSVPTGNFGDIYAGHLARAMGFPIGLLAIATNRNDILVRCLKSGVYNRAVTMASKSPSMDISVASNFERYLVEANGGDRSIVADLMESLKTQEGFTLSDAAFDKMRTDFTGAAVCDEETLATMARLYTTTGEVLDPHTAIGVAAAEEAFAHTTGPKVTLGTAHPAKFGASVKEAVGFEADLPPHMADLLTRQERAHVTPPDLEAIKPWLLARA